MFYSITFDNTNGDILNARICSVIATHAIDGNRETIAVDTFDIEQLDLYCVDLTTRTIIKKSNANQLVIDKKWHEIKTIRNKSLTDSDWTELPSAIERNGAEWSSAWQTYRQALRDITTQADPYTITWPTRPNF